MSHGYTTVQWNRNKRRYDTLLLAGVLGYLLLFVTLGMTLHAQGDHFSPEILVLRALGTCALLLLHVALAIGPLARLDARLLPLLYNRRHLGVTTFALAALHGALALLYYGGFGRSDPLRAVLGSYGGGGTLSGFPFEVLGFSALLVLFVMAVTSHDFFLANLGSRTWKWIHMSVYAAWLVLVGHVALGALQSERHPVLAVLLASGVVLLSVLHLEAARVGRRRDAASRREAQPDGWLDAGPLEGIELDHALRVRAPDGQTLAIFRQGQLAHALGDTCAHQGGPLCEGRLVDGDVTCPWHGWQYRPDTGCSPPPFEEQVPHHATRLEQGRVLVDPRPEQVQPTPSGDDS